jgi:hypothetical protein
MADSQHQQPASTIAVGDAPAPATTVPAAAATTAALPPASFSQPWGDVSLQQLRAALQHFAAERDWGQYHTPRNLLLALVRAWYRRCHLHGRACSPPD